ncbi:Mitochondrial export translocase Oxa1 [Aspergillus sclerotialis]|uniref:Mitochondrial export translocase Oxa1 n=1 Tax=Aspergillus sclerotialis TaxID=2070753 RepID=A0A3A2ZJY6_9EURO|nr:Mitochondrial export translocase Oxa1 [Aspergillus sclerotialis]
MIGGTGLKGPGKLPSISRQQWIASPRLTRSISSLRSPVTRFSAPNGGGNHSLAGKLAWRRAVPVIGTVCARFNSTSTGPSAAPESTSSTPPASTPDPGSTDFSDLSNVDVTSIPEKIGYLKDLGLDYGWGPTSFMQYVIEHLHMWAGLPWWASTVGAGLLIRFLLLKPMMGAADNGAKMHNIKPILAPYNERMRKAQIKGDRAELLQVSQEMRGIRSEHGIKLRRTFLPLIQVPFGYGVYRAVRGMASLPVPGLANESFAWIKDFTVADPTYILPLISSLSLHYSLKKGGESGTMDISMVPIWKGMSFLFPVVTFIGMQFFPSALQLYFVGTGLFGVFQATLLNNNNFRRFANITIPVRHQNIPGPLDSLRRLGDERLAMQEKARAETEAAKRNELSFIDRQMNSLSNKFSSFKEEAAKIKDQAQTKTDELLGKQQTTNANGSPGARSRRTQEELARAANYEKRRREQEEEERELRNWKRRMEYERRRGKK